MKVLALVPLAACFARPAVYGECSSDAQCRGGDVCARTGDCVAPSALAQPVALAWTFHGQPADATWCTKYPALDLVLLSDNGDPDLFVRDLPCASSGMTLDRIPLHLPYFQLGIASAPQPVRFPDPAWDGHYVAPGTTSVTFALAP